MCSFVTAPGIIFASSTDQTGALPGLECQPLPHPLPGNTPKQWYTFWKIARLIESLPF